MDDVGVYITSTYDGAGVCISSQSEHHAHARLAEQVWTMRCLCLVGLPLDAVESAQDGDAVVERRGIQIAPLVCASHMAAHLVEQPARSFAPALVWEHVVKEHARSSTEQRFNREHVVAHALETVVAVDEREIDQRRGIGAGHCSCAHGVDQRRRIATPDSRNIFQSRAGNV